MVGSVNRLAIVSSVPGVLMTGGRFQQFAASRMDTNQTTDTTSWVRVHSSLDTSASVRRRSTRLHEQPVYLPDASSQ